MFQNQIPNLRDPKLPRLGFCYLLQGFTTTSTDKNSDIDKYDKMNRKYNASYLNTDVMNADGTFKVYRKFVKCGTF